MSYVARDAANLDGTASVGSGQCVALVQQKAGAPLTRNWSKGAGVKGNTAIAVGTAIATFDDSGHYASNARGNHAAIYLGQDASGIRVVDQWVDRHGVHRSPSIRVLKFDDTKGASDNGNRFSVIE